MARTPCMRDARAASNEEFMRAARMSRYNDEEGLSLRIERRHGQRKRMG